MLDMGKKQPQADQATTILPFDWLWKSIIALLQKYQHGCCHINCGGLHDAYRPRISSRSTTYRRWEFGANRVLASIFSQHLYRRTDLCALTHRVREIRQRDQNFFHTSTTILSNNIKGDAQGVGNNKAEYIQIENLISDNTRSAIA